MNGPLLASRPTYNRFNMMLKNQGGDYQPGQST